MAAPNLAVPTLITGLTTTLALTTSAQTLLNNAAASGTVIKVNSLYVSNIDGSSIATLTLNHYSQDDIGGTAVAMASTIPVYPNTTLVVIEKDSAVYLTEDRSLGALASANGDLVAVISYEVIS